MVVERHHVVPVAADVDAFDPRHVTHRDVDPVDPREHVGQHAVLERLRDRALLGVQARVLGGEPFGPFTPAHQAFGQRRRTGGQEQPERADEPPCALDPHRSERLACGHDEVEVGVAELDVVGRAPPFERQVGRAREEDGRGTLAAPEVHRVVEARERLVLLGHRAPVRRQGLLGVDDEAVVLERGRHRVPDARVGRRRAGRRPPSCPRARRTRRARAAPRRIVTGASGRRWPRAALHRRRARPTHRRTAAPHRCGAPSRAGTPREMRRSPRRARLPLPHAPGSPAPPRPAPTTRRAPAGARAGPRHARGPHAPRPRAPPSRGARRRAPRS